MDTLRICQSCRKPLPADAPEGLCPECLLKAGFGSAPGTATSAETRFVPPSVQALAQVFPQLEILELIGQGGMGAVYKARQPGLDRLVALKILPPRAGTDPGFAERFTREARALAKLSHPNIVAVYDFGQAGGLNYFIMEYVDGPNLRQIEQAGKLSPRDALQIIPQICEALQFAHDEGIVHRDIKPENVLLDKKGRVKIADFGLAKILGREARDVRLTGTKDVMGTPHYMAPEQVEHPQAVDHRADIYSLGVVFYEMLTGELPLGRFAPPSARVPGMQIDVRVDEVVLRTLERQPERRYQQASEVKSDLETIATRPSQSPPLTAANEGQPPSAAAEQVRNQVHWPAVGLLVTGTVNWLTLPLVIALVLPAVSHARALALGHVQAWHGHALGLTQLTVILLLATPFVLCSFLIYAGLKMMRLEAYGAAVAASIVAMVVTPGNFIGFPIGIWSLVTLRRREVRQAFQERKRALAATGPSPSSKRAARYWLVGAGAVVLVLGAFLLLRAARPAPVASTPAVRVVKAFTAADAPISGDLALTEDGAWAVTCTATQTFRLFEVPDPEVEQCILTYRARLKTEGLAGRAYLEMWCRFPGKGEFFSRGLDNVVSGSNDWATYQTPFFLKAGEKPDLIRLNLVIEGRGRVFIKDIQLQAAPPGWLGRQ